MEDHEAFGTVLKRFRKQRKLAQEDFDTISSRTYLSALERGLKNPTIDKVGQLASVLDVHPLSLLAATYLEKDSTLSLEDLLRQVREEIEGLEQQR